MKTKQLLIVVMFLFASAAPVPADNHAASISSLRNRAVQGEALAQLNLGIMYQSGQGVPQDYIEAYKRFNLAAAQGIALAQVFLGLMYSEGQGVPQDYVQAHKWFNLAAANSDKPDHHNLAVQSRDKLAALMTPAQIAGSVSI